MEKVVVDANVIITFLLPPTSDQERSKLERVKQLFNRIYNGNIEAYLPEIVLHETFYTLLGRRFPDTHLPTLCGTIAAILDWPGWALDESERAIILRAMDILQIDPKLEYSDAAIAARAEFHNAELATFDSRLAKAYGGNIWTRT